MMTRREKLGKEQIIKKLSQEGYPTYAELFSLFDLHLTKDPEVVAYMIPDEAEITVNEALDIEQVSTVIRHEILHEFLEHKKRIEKIGGKVGQISNIAGDYDISNVGYTDKDKAIARSIKIGDRILKGLVTDFDHPDWVDLSFEEIYEKLLKEDPGAMQQPSLGNQGSRGIQGGIQEAEKAQRRAEAVKEKAQQAQQGPGDGQEEKNEDSQGEEGQDGDDQGQSSQDESSEERQPDDSPENSEGGDEQEGESQTSDKSSSSGKKRNKYDDDEYKNMSPEQKKKERARRRREAAKKLEKEADKLIDEITDVLDDSKNTGEKGDEVFDTPEERKEREQRIQKIKEILGDLEKGGEAIRESSVQIQTEKAAKAAKDANKYRNSPLTKFTESLTKFIRDELARSRAESWSHINKKYVNSGLLKPGQSYSARGKIPLINVYFDRSGSWTPEKTKKGQEAIATLNRYVTRGEIKLNLYYFNTEVGSVDMGGSGGTSGEPVLQHILQTKPNNVIILTDNDIRDCKTKVTIPGALWCLFYETDHNQIYDYIDARKLKKKFRVE